MYSSVNELAVRGTVQAQIRYTNIKKKRHLKEIIVSITVRYANFHQRLWVYDQMLFDDTEPNENITQG